MIKKIKSFMKGNFESIMEIVYKMIQPPKSLSIKEIVFMIFRFLIGLWLLIALLGLILYILSNIIMVLSIIFTSIIYNI